MGHELLALTLAGTDGDTEDAARRWAQLTPAETFMVAGRLASLGGRMVRALCARDGREPAEVLADLAAGTWCGSSGG